MKIRKLIAAVFAALMASAFGLMAAPAATADEAPAIYKFGTPLPLTAPTGQIAEWTVRDLRQSNDVIPFPVRGQLWEATATVRAVHGGVTPVVSDFNARTPSGAQYRVMFNVDAPHGISPANLAEGQSHSGKLYFDVLGQAPDSVVYNTGPRDVLIWVR